MEQRQRKKKPWWGIIYSLVLIAFTLYMLADTFLITRVYTVVDNSQSTEKSDNTELDSEETNDAKKTESVITENTYSDEHINITLSEYRENDTTIYVADVVLSSADYLKTAFAQNVYGRNVAEKTSDIAESAGAILAINGDYYGAQETGYVIRDGILYRDDSEDGQEDLVRHL